MASYPLGKISKSRMEAFSDGVFAIVVTLLVFQVRLPQAVVPDNITFFKSLQAVLPRLLSWINSFLIICVIWMNHHRLLELFKEINTGVFWYNNLLLMFTSLIPFPTEVVGDNPFVTACVSFYGICLAIPALCFTLLRWYVLQHTNILKEGVQIDSFRKATCYSLLYGPGLYLTGAMLSWISVWLAFAVYVFVPLYFIFPATAHTESP